MTSPRINAEEKEKEEGDAQALTEALASLTELKDTSASDLKVQGVIEILQEVIEKLKGEENQLKENAAEHAEKVSFVVQLTQAIYVLYQPLAAEAKGRQDKKRKRYEEYVDQINEGLSFLESKTESIIKAKAQIGFQLGICEALYLLKKAMAPLPADHLQKDNKNSSAAELRNSPFYPST